MPRKRTHSPARRESKRFEDNCSILAARRRTQAVITAGMLLSLIVGGTMLAFSGAVEPAPTQREKTAGAESIQGLNPGSPSKEMVYAGARLVATEEPESCTPLITPTYRSFPATPGTDPVNNPGTANISITIGSTCNWTATSNAGWINIQSGGSGTGNGTVTYSVAQNTSAIRTGTITVGGQTFTVYQGPEFTDVPATPTPHLFYPWIGRLAARGVTVGCTGSTYCPNEAVIQEQMAAFVIRALGQLNPPVPPPPPRFNDVPASNPFYAFIEQMAVRGIWTGCGGGNYCPVVAVRRDEMAAIIIRGRGESNPPTPPTQRFSDVPPSNSFYSFVDRMGVLGITSGCGGGNYCPADSVTRGQMAVFLVRAFNL